MTVDNDIYNRPGDIWWDERQPLHTIRTALNLAGPDDILLVAGKGHEKYQEIKGVKYPFDDKSVLMELFELLDK